jgi:uncharacterized membrane protein (DUF373 family)
MTTLKLTGHLERAINVALLVMLALVVLLATVDLGWIILKDLLTPPVFLLDADELLELFGAFLLVMMGLELLDTVKIYITQKTIHVEVVLLVGIIAIARKVVILEPKGMDALSLIGIAAIIFSLTAGYYFVMLAARNGRLLISQAAADTGAENEAIASPKRL